MSKPRVEIQFCTQCKWNFRAVWYLQELLSTFGNALGEVALVPATSGVFIVKVSHIGQDHVIWDRKLQGGFPDSKELKRLVRDIIAPDQNLGHVDKIKETEGLMSDKSKEKGDVVCEDCERPE